MSNSTQQRKSGNQNQKREEGAQPTCGIIRPISAMEGYSKKHWDEIDGIIREVAEKECNLTTHLVSDLQRSEFIQKKIISNLYSNDIIICDVSGTNPNVMFELGLRLAFDMPTIIIKDYVTEFVFDTGFLQHLEYPTNLNYYETLEFKNELKGMINDTLKASKDSNYSPFLKNFGTLQPKKLKEEDLDINSLYQSLDFLNNKLSSLEYQLQNSGDHLNPYPSKARLLKYEVDDVESNLLIRRFIKEFGLNQTSSIDQSSLLKMFKDFLEKRNLNLNEFQEREFWTKLKSFLDNKFGIEIMD